MTKHFVWINTHSGPIAQIWHEVCDSQGKLKPYLACHAIADDDPRDLDQLKKDFKYEPAKAV